MTGTRETTAVEALRIYLAGPMTGLPDYNYPAFAEAEVRGTAMGLDIHSPHKNFNEVKTLPYATYIRADMAMLLNCNAIALLPGWERSRGAKFELHVAQLLGHAVFDATDFSPMTVPEVRTVLAPDDDLSILQEAEDIVSGARQAAYGHPLDDFSKTAKMWSGLFGVEITAEQVALGMMAVKMSRLLNTPNHRDSMVDIAGYAKTYQLVTQERKRRKDAEASKA
jgi:hypothetical protein